MVQIQLLLQSVKRGEPHHCTKLIAEKYFEQQWEYSMLLPPLEKRTLNWALAGRPLKSPLPLLDNMMWLRWFWRWRWWLYTYHDGVSLFVCEWWKMITFSRRSVGPPRSVKKWPCFSRIVISRRWVGSPCESQKVSTFTIWHLKDQLVPPGSDKKWTLSQE